MKKLLLSAVAIATLSTGAFASGQFYDKLNSQTQKMQNGYLLNTDKVCKGDRNQLFANRLADAVGTSNAIQITFGTMSNTVIESYAGTGISKTIGWEQVLRSYNDFLCTLSDTEKLNLVFFLYARAYDKMEDPISTLRITQVFYKLDRIEKNNKGSDTFSLIDSIAFSRMALNWNNDEFIPEDNVKTDKNFKKFFSAIAKRDLVEAKRIVLADERTNKSLNILYEFLRNP